MFSIKFETKLKKADKKILEDHLSDAGYGECNVNIGFQELKMPDIYKSEKSLIASVVSQAGDYKLDMYIDDIAEIDD